MKIRLYSIAAVLALASGSAAATDGASPDALALWEQDRSTVFQAADVDLEDFRWIARPVVVFADTPRQTRLRRADGPSCRNGWTTWPSADVVIIVDTDPDARSDLRRKLRPRGFMLTIIGKDGGVKLRKPLPWSVREINRSIDKMPIRQREIDEARNPG